MKTELDKLDGPIDEIRNSDTTPYWSTSATFPRFTKLAEDVVADVVLVGAGVTGLSAAYLLAKAGKRVMQDVQLPGGATASRAMAAYEVT